MTKNKGRVPRSGGRIAEQRERESTASEYRVAGSAALAPEPARDRAVADEPARGRGGAAQPKRNRAAEPGRDARLNVAPPPPVVTPRTPFVVLVLVLVVCGVLGILVLNTKIAENAFRLANLEQRGGQLSEEEQQLRQDLEEQSSSGNLEAQARRLGLVPSGKRAYLRLPDGRVFEMPQPATGEPSVTSQNSTGGR
jgi:hypothetical protein